MIKIMPDYNCYPLWQISDGLVININPGELPLSPELKGLLSDWQNKYDDTLNKMDPINSGFRTREDEMNFELQGLTIWKRLIREIGNEYVISYFSTLQNKILDIGEDSE